MAKRLTTQTKIQRLRDQGFSRKQLARSFGVSVSSVGRAERGETKGATVEKQASQFYKLTKGAKANVISGQYSLPSAPAPRARTSIVERIVSPLERAMGQVIVQDSDAALVIQITMKGTGKSKTLFAHGGTSKAHLLGNLRGVISAQYKSQYRGDSIDWDDVIDIDIQEY